MNHYTSRDGYKGIRSQSTWLFRAHKPPGSHPPGAYFTTLGPEAPHLAARLRIPRAKLEYIFSFRGSEELWPVEGGRGGYIFFSVDDYAVPSERQLGCGETGL